VDFPIQKLLLTILPPVLNFTVAKNLIKIHTKVATKRTYKENWKTVEEFEKSLVIKTYIFNFLNLFNSFFIIGLIKPQYFKSDTRWHGFGKDLFGQCTSFDLVDYGTNSSNTRILSFFNGIARFLQGGILLTDPKDYGNS